MPIYDRLPDGFTWNGDMLDCLGDTFGTLDEVPGGYQLVVEVFFGWDHGYPGEPPDDAQDRFDEARQPVLDAWAQLGAKPGFGEDLLFNREPLHFLEKLSFDVLDEEAVLEILRRSLSMPRSFISDEPGRVTETALAARFGAALATRREAPGEVSLCDGPGGGCFATWDVASQRLIVPVPVRIPLAVPPERSSEVASVGAALAAELSPVLAALGFSCEGLWRVEDGDGSAWEIPAARACASVDDVDRALRDAVAAAAQLGAARPGTVVGGPLTRFLAGVDASSR